MLVPDPFDEVHNMKHNSALTCQSQLELMEQKLKYDLSLQYKNFGH